MRHTILFLAANPNGTDRLALDQEAHAIQAELERSGHRGSFEFVTRWAVEPLDLLRELRALRPTVVHFSGHGVQHGAVAPRWGQGPRRDVGDGSREPDAGEPAHGLLFHGRDHRGQIVSTAAIAEAFGAAGASVRVVILNACYTEVQAEALLEHVDCVVGMGGAILDDAARSFAVGFYGGLAAREPIATAYRQGRAALGLVGLHGRAYPQLRVRAGVDAERLVLALPEASPAVSSAARPGGRQVNATNYVERGILVQGDQIIQSPPRTTEQEREARYRRLERQRQEELNVLYRNDPAMRQRYSEVALLKAAGVGLAILVAIALAAGKL